jgi:hypothetical protein
MAKCGRKRKWTSENPVNDCNGMKAKRKYRSYKKKGKEELGTTTLELDVRQIRELGKIHCTNQEVARVMGCSYSLIRSKYLDVIEEGREQGKASLRHAQYKRAMEGNPTMLIWLGKHLLGQRDEIRLSTVEPEAREFLRRLEEMTPAGLDQKTADVKLEIDGTTKLLDNLP